MRKMISVRTACNVILFINVLSIVMHVLILVKILPASFVWGGRLENESQILAFEIISIFVQVVFMFIIALKAGYILKGRFTKSVQVGIWLLFGIMVLNTAGNLVSNSTFEMMVMTPITGMLAVLLFRLGMDNNLKAIEPELE
ncbi:hypothetical protein QWY16_09980 [Planococcus shenhongbingii]|uniref:hypothetical protein n=1 Tax=Planococcus shenhongbingii TaxID=3058398 RepID=UPI002603D03F|nr:hypothetical protein [Planococcus sp. N016]WKA56845.1 hypothetical protein QWY16_09980 [Planococcus sp. N016]